jgi:microcompartment protein CcmK/EutM
VALGRARSARRDEARGVIAGTLIGEVWSTRKAPGLDGRRLALVAVAGEDRVLVAVDTLDGRAGQDVLVAMGSGARRVIDPGPGERSVLCDAAIALLVDGREVESGP